MKIALFLLAVLTSAQATSAQVTSAQAAESTQPEKPKAMKESEVTTGYVRVKVDISETGEVVHAEVVEAEPVYLFDKMALREVYQMKFEPLVVDGKPMKREGVIFKMDFEQ